MKTLATFRILLFRIASSTLQVQQLAAKSYLEQTYEGPKLGTAIGVIFSFNIEVGGFYQEHTHPFGDSESLPWLTE
ncbi:MAG: hypothetical protein JXR10_16935 [Cyclobacteriaceae bacterium]